MGPRFDRRTLSRAKPAALLRLARWLGVRAGKRSHRGWCPCSYCHGRRVERLVRKLDGEEVAFPPRLTERKW